MTSKEGVWEKPLNARERSPSRCEMLGSATGDVPLLLVILVSISYRNFNGSLGSILVVPVHSCLDLRVLEIDVLLEFSDLLLELLDSMAEQALPTATTVPESGQVSIRANCTNDGVRPKARRNAENWGSQHERQKVSRAHPERSRHTPCESRLP